MIETERRAEIEEQKYEKKEKRHGDDGDSGVNMSVWPSQETGELTLVIV